MLGEVGGMAQGEVVDSGADAPDAATISGAAALPDRLQGEVVASGADAPDGAKGSGAAVLPDQLGRAYSAAAAVMVGRGGVPQWPTFAPNPPGPQH